MKMCIIHFNSCIHMVACTVNNFEADEQNNMYVSVLLYYTYKD